MRPALSTQRTLVATALLGMLVVGGCGNNGDDDGGSAPTASVKESDDRVPGPASVDDADGDLGRGLDGPADMDQLTDGFTASSLRTTAELGAPSPREQEANDPLQGPAIIYQASVSAQSDDVQQARFDAMDVMDQYGGTLAADETATGDDGKMKNARMIFRIPSEDFEAAYADLQKVGDNVEAHSGSEDVTTEVIDVEARIRAQEQSLARIEALLAQAQKLRTIIAIESQLSRRQADLDSLKSRQAYLENQTSEATIAMHIQRTPEEEKPKDEDDKGFLAGLSDGWDGLVAATVGIATVVGVLLPFAIVLALLGVPLVALVRRLRPMRPVAEDQSSG